MLFNRPMRLCQCILTNVLMQIDYQTTFSTEFLHRDQGKDLAVSFAFSFFPLFWQSVKKRVWGFFSTLSFSSVLSFWGGWLFTYMHIFWGLLLNSSSFTIDRQRHQAPDLLVSFFDRFYKVSMPFCLLICHLLDY